MQTSYFVANFAAAATLCRRKKYSTVQAENCAYFSYRRRHCRRRSAANHVGNIKI